MRTPLLAVWLCLPLAAWAYHEGPGQDQSQLDEVDRELARADEAAADRDWDAAIQGYEAALAALPEGHVHAERRMRLALAQAQMQFKQLPTAQKALASMVSEMLDDPDADPALLDEARAAHASAQYYVTWLMRLEGYVRKDWEPEIEVARQTYRLLAERADAAGDKTQAKRFREDLEAAVKLARMELEELQGLPLPNQ
ncbi:MAG: hypothetical protein AAF628_21785 [Planctomycetota bacterium]